MTFVLLLVCIALILAVAAVVHPVLVGDDERDATRAVVDHIASLVQTPVDPALPEGRSWLHGPGPLPAGPGPGESWPLRRWLGARSGEAYEDRIPTDAWGRAIAILPAVIDGRPVMLVVSAGLDGVIQSSPASGIVEDDVGRLVYAPRSG